MRSADAAWAVILIGAAVAGCSSIPLPFASASNNGTGTGSNGTTPRLAAPGASAPAPSRNDAAPPISASVQRSFDEALRAMRAGRNDEAQRGFIALTQSNPDLGGPHANLGVIYGRAGKWAEAATELERAVQASPQQPLYANQLGIAYRQKGDFAKARAAYEKAISLDANYAAPCLNLGILHDLYLGDGQRALELYERYLALTPTGDATVTKWIADLKNRKPRPAATLRKEKE